MPAALLTYISSPPSPVDRTLVVISDEDDEEQARLLVLTVQVGVPALADKTSDPVLPVTALVTTFVPAVTTPPVIAFVPAVIVLVDVIPTADNVPLDISDEHEIAPPVIAFVPAVNGTVIVPLTLLIVILAVGAPNGSRISGPVRPWIRSVVMLVDAVIVDATIFATDIVPLVSVIVLNVGELVVSSA